MKTTTALAAATLILLWSLSWVVMKGAQAWCGPVLFGALSCAVGLLPTLPKMLRQRRPDILSLCFIGFIGVGGFQIAGQEALALAGPGRTVVLIYSMPFWATLMAWAWLGEHPSRACKVGLLFAAVGVLLVVAPWQGVAITASLLALASGAAWGLGAVATRVFLTRHQDYPVVALTGWQLLAGCLVLFPVALLRHDAIASVSPSLLGALAYSGLLCGAVAWALWGLVVRRLPMAGAGIVTLLVPPAGVFFAWLCLGEEPTLHEGIGLCFILAGFVASLWPSPGEPPAQQSLTADKAPARELAPARHAIAAQGQME